jgi:ATP-dependent RNA helicase DDX10/DBP4
MPARTAGKQKPPHKPNKTELKKQKRKRDHEDLQKLEQAIAELVSETDRKLVHA